MRFFRLREMRRRCQSTPGRRSGTEVGQFRRRQAEAAEAPFPSNRRAASNHTLRENKQRRSDPHCCGHARTDCVLFWRPAGHDKDPEGEQ